MATNEQSAAQVMTEMAEAERKKAFARNEYNPVKEDDGYDVNHKNANSDGDSKGRGTASYLGVHGNLYNSKNEYHSTSPNAESSNGSAIELTP